LTNQIQNETVDAHGSIDGYSAFRHLVSALFLKPSDLILIVAPDPPTLYCDRSQNGQFTVVAGAVASVQDWNDFDNEWSPALEENNLRYFRMSEFAQSVGEFKTGWKKNEDRRRKLLERLVGIIANHIAVWIGICVSQKDYDAADRIYQLREFLQPYPLCGVTCIERRNLDYMPMEYIFEEGDEYYGQLSERVRQDFGKYPLFRPKIVTDDTPNQRPVTPLQVGDFAAYEIGKFYSLIDPDMNRLFEKFRGSFRLLGDIPQSWGQIEEHAIRVGCNLRGVPRRAVNLLVCEPQDNPTNGAMKDIPNGK
jgi:hypothetical protein